MTAATLFKSSRFAPDSAGALRDRVCAEAVPTLARGLLAARGLGNPSAGDLAETYELTLTVLFRLLFLAHAEDWGPLAVARGSLGNGHSLQALTRGQFKEGVTLWEEVGPLLQALGEGSPEAAGVAGLLARVSLPDTVVGPVLRALLPPAPSRDPRAAGPTHETAASAHKPEAQARGAMKRPLACSSGLCPEFCPVTLSVRDFGALYERLLESELSVAAVALTVDERGLYRPCRDGEAPRVRRGEVYLHDRSGARKASGTYFTPQFAVEHLLDHALEPALAEHLARLDGLGEADAGARFFDFRVADLAVGSGYFLVAAVDRIERTFTRYLAKRPLPQVGEEFNRLRRSAEGVVADAALLRRLIACHCLYGVDTNPVAVHLARLALGCHTFVPGLPLSLPGGRLAVGNALVGAPGLPEGARAAFDSLRPFDFPAAFPEVFQGERAGFDVILGNPPWQEATLEEHAFWARHYPGLRSLGQRQQEARRAALRRERPDLVQQYRRELAEADALRAALGAGQYPGMGVGDADLYKAFCWRSWCLVAAEGGWLGVVLPRAVWTAKGSAEFRAAALAGADPLDVTVLLNRRAWVFPGVHPQYSVALVAARRGRPRGRSLMLRGPFRSPEGYRAGMTRPPGEFTAAEVAGWTDSAALPLLPAEESLKVFARLRQAPRLDLEGRGWRARPHAELHATNDKGLLDVASAERPRGYWPVYKGESFDLWQPDTGRYYAWAEPGAVLEALQARRLRAGRNRRSPFAEFDPAALRAPGTLPCLGPRVAFRDVTNRTNQRTVIAALVPPNVLLANQAPFLLWPRGDRRAEAYLLGVLSSLPLDWYARRFVENHVNFHLLNPLPVPRPPETSPLYRRAVALAGRLAAVDEQFAGWAEAVGVECGLLDAAERQDHIHELDAVVALLYGLEERQLVHVFETFHDGWDHAERLKRTLAHYRRWRGK